MDAQSNTMEPQASAVPRAAGGVPPRRDWLFVLSLCGSVILGPSVWLVYSCRVGKIELSEALFGVGLVTLTLGALCAVLLCQLRDDGTTLGAAAAVVARAQAALEKLPREEVRSLDLEATPVERRSCSVCLADFAEGDEQLVLPCFHVFHTACAEQWLEKHLRCPMCRFEVNLHDASSNEKAQPLRPAARFATMPDPPAIAAAWSLRGIHTAAFPAEGA